MAEVLTPDICVIGAGAGGLSAATTAAACGVPVVLVEKDRPGGWHLRTDMPAATLGGAARRAEMLRQARTFGLNLPRPKVDFGEVHDHIQRVIETVAVNDSAERLGALGVRLVQGTASFSDPRTVAAGDIEIKARRFVIATGSSPAIPPIPGLEEVTHFTPEGIFDLRACPKHLIVLGGGASGLEIGQAFQRLGAEVTVLDIAQPLAGYDAECAAIVREQLAREGVVLRGGAEIAQVKQTRSKIQVLLRTADGEEKIDGSHLLVAAGEAPNIEALNLFAAGIKYSRTGITVDKGLKTANKKVYAIGAVAGGPGHAAEDQAAQVIRNALFRQRVRGNPREVTQAIHTDPEFAQVGLTEADAAVQRLAVRVLRWPYRENDRAQAEKEVQGHIKVITSTRGKILGAAIVGVRAGDLITPWSLAISHGMNVGAVAGLAVPYRTFAEVSKRAAMSYFAPGLGGQWLRRAMGALRLLG